MAFWVYKCNSKNERHQIAYGDWNDFFSHGSKMGWGRTEWVPKLAELAPHDKILAYQTDRNELVGVAEVVRVSKMGVVILKPIREIRTKVRPLKRSNPKIGSIPALQPGPIKTIYSITAGDAKLLLNAAKDVQNSE